MRKDKTDDQWLELRNAIILQAVSDFNALEKGTMQPTSYVNKEELIRFFRTDCNGLLSDMENTKGMDILRAIKYDKRQRIFTNTLRKNN